MSSSYCGDHYHKKHMVRSPYVVGWLNLSYISSIYFINFFMGYYTFIMFYFYVSFSQTYISVLNSCPDYCFFMVFIEFLPTVSFHIRFNPWRDYTDPRMLYAYNYNVSPFTKKVDWRNLPNETISVNYYRTDNLNGVNHYYILYQRH